MCFFFFKKKRSNFSTPSLLSSDSEFHSCPSFHDLLSETCESRSISLLSGHSSCHEVRSSRPCVGRFPLGLDDLTLWLDEWPDNRETLLLLRVSLKTSASSFWPPLNPSQKKKLSQMAKSRTSASWICNLEDRMVSEDRVQASLS